MSIILATVILIAIIALFVGLQESAKKTMRKVRKDNELAEKRARIQKYYDEEKETAIKREIHPHEEIIKEEKPLHVNQSVQNIEKQFFNHQKNTTTRPSYQENKKRGNDYEQQVGEYYEKIGYKVIYHGLNKGRKDGGIDLIAENSYEIILIQCKAWKNAIVKQKHVKEFIGNCAIFLEDNPQNTTMIKRHFVTSSETEDHALSKYLIQHRDKIQVIIMPFQI
ncbi:MAG: restriction endonuclease [Sulfurospirillaceae bacterium]|nr:restriction endonuclease [Sulfurospirillaceae bacterium]